MATRPPPVQDPGITNEATTPSITKASPFASSPVAIVNQARPGFGAIGQFPGHAVRAASTQLSTPLVPQRQILTSIASISSDPSTSFSDGRRSHPPEEANEVFRQPVLEDGLMVGDVRQASVPSLQRHRNSVGPFGRLSAPSQMQPASSEVLEEEKTLFSPTFPLQQPNQQENYESLIYPDGFSAPSPPMLSRHSSFTAPQSPMHSKFSKSLLPSVQNRATLQFATYQQQSSAQSSGQAPLPIDPGLDYTDNIRSQSVRVSSSSQPTPGSVHIETQKIPRPSRYVALDLPTTTHQITPKALTANELIDQFMKMQVDERFVGNGIAAPVAKKMYLEDIPDTIEGLEAMYTQKRWKSLTKKALLMLQKPPKNLYATLEIKSWWLAGLIKEGHYDNAASVLDQVGNIDQISILDGCNQFVRIRLYLLQALLSKCQGKLANHEKQLFHLISRLKVAIQQKSTKALLNVEISTAARWLRIAQFALANHLVSQQKFTLALRICSVIDEHYVSDQEKVIILSRVGRIRLQMGDLEATQKLFDAARHLIDRLKLRSGDSPTVAAEDMAALEARLLFDDGLLFFAQNKLQEALSAFESVMYLHVKADDVEADLFLGEDIVCSAVNNYAICALYCCDVKAAVAALEQMIRSNPRRFLNGVLVFNLSSLYDLLFDNVTSKNRKEMLKKIADICFHDCCDRYLLL
ncbi:Uncharacterized conserved protein [Plasmopara halstedii]|uniref:Uncharacterized conserved protein n=1 Tax=Plasmopara halstedii TaxID=4781 RepID=A0A0P1AQI3_PLAHL|nr:Uncharacterized conserved protein [Plasmopara halstedii]CEG43728.1 Uncharacterized conserved protein [Plasmopara halstedii]|eukprot:XP_024580097.1 Uncharacterized conserved protein [Plasmopara halstedii]